MVIKKGIEKVLAIPQEQLASGILRNSNNISINIYIIYNPNDSNVLQKVREIYRNLQTRGQTRGQRKETHYNKINTH